MHQRRGVHLNDAQLALYVRFRGELSRDAKARVVNQHVDGLTLAVGFGINLVGYVAVA